MFSLFEPTVRKKKTLKLKTKKSIHQVFFLNLTINEITSEFSCNFFIFNMLLTA